MKRSFYRGNMRNKLFVRILLYFLSLLLPLIVGGLLFYANFEKKLKLDFADKLELNLQSSANTVDIFVNTAQEIGSNFFYDPSVRSLLLPFELYSAEERSGVSVIPRMLSRLSTIIWYSVENVFVYADTQKVYTSRGLDDYDVFFAKAFAYTEYDGDFWTARLSGSPRFEVLGASDVHSQNSASTRVIPIVISDFIRGHRAVMVVNISADMIHRYLLANSLVESPLYVVVDASGNVVFSDHDELDDEPLLRRLLAEREAEYETYETYRLDGNDYVVTRTSSELYGWRYYAFTPEFEFHNQTRGAFGFILLLGLALFLVGVLCSFVFTFKLYNPIRKVRDILKDKGDLVQAGEHAHNEMEFIGHGVAQLIRHSDTYKDKLDTISTEYLNTTIANLLLNTGVSNAEDLERTLREQLRFSGAFYQVCCLQLTYKESLFEEINDVSPQFIHRKLKNMICSMLLDVVQLYMLELKPGLLALVIHMKEPDAAKAAFIRRLQSIMEPLRYDARYCEARIGLGGIHASPASLHKSFVEAMTALEHSRLEPPFHITDASSLDIAYETSYSAIDENRLSSALSGGNWEYAQSVAEEMIRSNRQKPVSYRHMNHLLAEMFATGQGVAAERELALRDLISEEEQALLKSEAFVDLDEKQSLLFDFLQAVMESLQEHAHRRGGELVAEVIRYLEGNYKQDLYLEKIADRFGLSPKYVSRLFKEKTGLNISDYIGKIRIDKAKRLIGETDLNIGDISENVGIFSRTTFIRLFKKYEGITPNEYRRLRK